MALDKEMMSVALQDPEIKASVKALVNMAIEEARFVLEFGTAQERASIMKLLVPSLVKGLRTQEEGESDKQAQEAYQEIREAFRTRIKQDTEE